MFKIAYGAGHILATAGKRLPKSLDPNQTREWTLNDRVARYFAEAAKQYEGVELLRVDDPEGEKNISLAARCAAANRWGADFCLAIHHNAAGRMFSGGGIEAYSYRGSSTGAKYRDAIYAACISAGGLIGDRANPKIANGFYVLQHTDAPAVLMEYGFMDSTVDAPVILTEAYSKLVAYATMEGIAKVAGLKKKAGADKPSDAYSLVQFTKDVQKACGAAVDGIAGEETIRKTVTLAATKNITHPAVKPVQKRLAELGYSQVGTIDGIAGAKFEQAVQGFQLDNGCYPDGEVAEWGKTWRKLLGMI